jgi:hypothetical protein
MSIYPNPAKNFFTEETGQSNSKLTFHDVAGETGISSAAAIIKTEYQGGRHPRRGTCSGGGERWRWWWGGVK